MTARLSAWPGIMVRGENMDDKPVYKPVNKRDTGYELPPDDVAYCRQISMRHSDRVKQIALAVTAETGMPISAIYGKSRKTEIVRARWLVMYLAAQDGMSHPVIGKALGLDASTVTYGIGMERKRRNGEGPAL